MLRVVKKKRPICKVKECQTTARARCSGEGMKGYCSKVKALDIRKVGQDAHKRVAYQDVYLVMSKGILMLVLEIAVLNESNALTNVQQKL